MSRVNFLYVLLVIMLIAGCSQADTSEPLNTPTIESTTTPLSLPTTGKWTIKMTHSGGIMGLLRSIEISSDGKYTVIDERAKQTVSGELGANELKKLMEVISTSKYIAPGDPNGMVCADCFVFDLDIQGSDSNLTIQLNDINLPESGMAELIGHLRGIIDSALK